MRGDEPWQTHLVRGLLLGSITFQGKQLGLEGELPPNLLCLGNGRRCRSTTSFLSYNRKQYLRCFKTISAIRHFGNFFSLSTPKTRRRGTTRKKNPRNKVLRRTCRPHAHRARYKPIKKRHTTPLRAFLGDGDSSTIASRSGRRLKQRSATRHHCAHSFIWF